MRGHGFRSLVLVSACASLLLAEFAARGAVPVVSNVRAAQRAGTSYVDITYDLADPDSSSLNVTVAVSTNAGTTWFYPGASLSGQVGSGIAPATGKQVAWNAGSDLPAKLFSNVRVQVRADDNVPPSGMVLIPAGSFTMGDPLDGESAALPQHPVYLSAFYMDKYDVTLALWSGVYQWATTHGYSFDNPGSGKAANHPVQNIYWYDAVKWCNARSELEGRTPAYYTSAAQTTVYRTGQVNVNNGAVNWNTGYRLPTEAEWEKAARGGLSGHRFPWGETITEAQANYYSCFCYPYDLSNTGFNPVFATGGYSYTSPVGYFAPNGYGLYDMAGNVWQWCWDWYDGAYYSSSPVTDPRGPTSGSGHVYRGGCWFYGANLCRLAHREDYWSVSTSLGFRSVLPPGQ